MDNYEFAKGLARILDRNSEMGLRQLVESRQNSLRRISDPHRPYRTLMHLIIDTVQPEHVPKLMPKGMVTVREAARILADMVSHSRLTPRGAPVVIDRDMHLFVFKVIFQYFLHLLTFDRYSEDADGRKGDEDLAADVPLVEFTRDGVTFNVTAHRRWSAIIGQPGHFQAIGDFLRNCDPTEYGIWYFRVMQAVVRLDRSPEEGELRLLLGELRRPRIVN